MKRKRSEVGVCKLTLAQGTFVDSHILPKALTRPSFPGTPFVESGMSRRPVRRWSSWYDNRLVTQAGERILEKLDTWAVYTLRKHRLVWSGWGGNASLTAEEHHIVDGFDVGIRKVSGLDTRKLRLFILSLLWRAAASSRPELGEVVLPEDDLEMLRKMLVEGSPDPISFYPAMLTQLSTRVDNHNQTPIPDVKYVPTAGGEPMRALQMYRFYLDGLIIHVHRQVHDGGQTQGLGSQVVGGTSDCISLSTVPFETSVQARELEAAINGMKTEWPELVVKLYQDGEKDSWR